MTRQRSPADDRPALATTIAALAHRIDTLDPGDRAVLRRGDPEAEPSLVFVKLALRTPLPDWEANVPAWQTIAAGMALLLPPGGRSAGPGLGRALADSDFSEARLERLLAAEGATLRGLFLRACRFLAARSVAIDWLDAARLLLTRKPDAARQARLHVATSYFRASGTSSTKSA